jgi:hypothetical protein
MRQEPGLADDRCERNGAALMTQRAPKGARRLRFGEIQAGLVSAQMLMSLSVA